GVLLHVALALERGDVAAGHLALRVPGGGRGGGDRRGRARGSDQAVLVAALRGRRLRVVGDAVGVGPLVDLARGLLGQDRGGGEREDGAEGETVHAELLPWGASAADSSTRARPAQARA